MALLPHPKHDRIYQQQPQRQSPHARGVDELNLGIEAGLRCPQHPPWGIGGEQRGLRPFEHGSQRRPRCQSPAHRECAAQQQIARRYQRHAPSVDQERANPGAQQHHERADLHHLKTDSKAEATPPGRAAALQRHQQGHHAHPRQGFEIDALPARKGQRAQ